MNAAIAFFDRYVRGTEDSAGLSSFSEEIFSFKYSSELGTAKLRGMPKEGRRPRLPPIH